MKFSVSVLVKKSIMNGISGASIARGACDEKIVAGKATCLHVYIHIYIYIIYLTTSVGKIK